MTFCWQGDDGEGRRGATGWELDGKSLDGDAGEYLYGGLMGVLVRYRVMHLLNILRRKRRELLLKARMGLGCSIRLLVLILRL